MAGSSAEIGRFDRTASSWTERREEYEAIARELSDVIRLTTKDGRFWQVTGWALQLLSFGSFQRQRFLEDFASTLGPIQAYPRRLEQLSPKLIVHEGRHTQQFLFAGWFVPIFGWVGRHVRVWAGMIPMALVYGFFPVPVFFAWGRFRLELDADAFAWRVSLERGWMTPDEVRARATWFAAVVSSWSYLKAWPVAWTRRAFQQRAEAVIRAWESELR